jgi:hypothetical protein
MLQLGEKKKKKKGKKKLIDTGLCLVFLDTGPGTKTYWTVFKD